MNQSRSILGRRSAFALAAGSAAAIWVSTLAVPAAVGTARAATPPAATRTSASAQAVATGTPVVVASLTTPTTQVTAESDGSFDMTSYSTPVRTDINGPWQPIDTTLQPDGNGGWAPAASVTPLDVSGGGSGPSVTLGQGNDSVSLTWGNLPTPTLRGDTATYPNVRPGVDLQVTAQAAGFTDTLVIHDAAAAQALESTPIPVTASSAGLDLTQPSGEGIQATVGTATKFAGSQAVAWDSKNQAQSATATPTAPAPSATDPENAQIDTAPEPVVAQSPSGASTSSVTLDVSAPPTAVTTSTQYPLYLDPDMAPTVAHYMTVQSGGWDYYDNPNQPLRVGYCGWAGCQSDQGNARSYFSFNTGAISNYGNGPAPIIYTASVSADQIWNATLSAEPVDLTKANGFNSSTNYPGPLGADIEQLSSAAGDKGNNPAFVTFHDSNVVAYVQNMANAQNSPINFSLSAPTPDNPDYWKKFGDNPELEVKYGYPPNTPTQVGISNAVSCAGFDPATADNSAASNGTASVLDLSAEAHDNNPGSSTTLGMSWEIWTNGTSPDVYLSNTPPLATTSDHLTEWATTDSTSSHPGAIPDGNYKVHAQAQAYVGEGSNNPSSVWSPWYYFSVDATPPNTPTVTVNNDANGNPTSVTLTNTSDDTAGFTYSFGTAAPPQIHPTDCGSSTGSDTGYVQATNGTATINLPSNFSGPQSFSAATYNLSHLQSTATSPQTIP